MLASAGWWALSAPSVDHGALAPPPDIDIDPPGMRAQREAALALATMPDDPWTFAESLAVEPAASAGDGGKERCGQDQVPVFSEPPSDVDGLIGMPQQTKPGGVGYTGAQRRIDAALRASADPFDQAIADALNIDGLRTPASRVDAVVQDAVGAGDARSYRLAFSVCAEPGEAADRASCELLDPRRWAEVDAGNAVPWVYALQQAKTRGDPDAQLDAFRHVASASRFDTHYGATAAVIAQLPLASADDLAAQVELTMRASAFDPIPPLAELTMPCRNKASGDPQMVATCEAISALMFDHSDALLVHVVGGSIHNLATGDPSRLEQAHRDQRALMAHWAPATGLSPCGLSRDVLKRFVRIGTLGEIGAFKEDLSKPIPP